MSTRFLKANAEALLCGRARSWSLFSHLLCFFVSSPPTHTHTHRTLHTSTAPPPSGLSNEEMAWANAAVAIPTHVPYPLPGSSLNLSHAGAIIIYEFFRVRNGSVVSETSSSSEPVPLRDLAPVQTKQACQEKIIRALAARGCILDGVESGSGDERAEEDARAGAITLREAKRRASSLLRRNDLTMKEVALLFRLANAAAAADVD